MAGNTRKTIWRPGSARTHWGDYSGLQIQLDFKVKNREGEGMKEERTGEREGVKSRRGGEDG